MKPTAEQAAFIAVVMPTAGHMTFGIGNCFSVTFFARQFAFLFASTAPCNFFISSIELKPL